MAKGSMLTGEELGLRSSAAECLRDVIAVCGQHVQNAQDDSVAL